LKQLTPHPWEVLGMDIAEGSIVKGKIVNVEDYGAFLEVSPGVEGLIHVTEVSWSNQPVAAREFFKIDQKSLAKVVTIDRDERKMSLSLKQLQEDPWNEIEEKYPVNSRHTGIVKNLTLWCICRNIKWHRWNGSHIRSFMDQTIFTSF
jgi:small subunit ribosomal protein S1